MAQSSQAIQTRIASVDSTKKITKAMQLVASSKLTKQRAAMDENRPYARGMKELLDLVLASAGKNNPYLKENEGKPTYWFVITSDMGLCGGYNANVYRTLLEEIKPGDIVVIIGSRGGAWAKSRKIETDSVLNDLNNDTAYDELSKMMNAAITLFEEEKIKDIKVLYTRYKNTLTFVPTVETILPAKKPETSDKKAEADTIFEPGKEDMLELLIPMACRNILYSDYLESKTSEQASRRMAMESATDNAEELSDQLQLAYNRIRQSAITQEITEIVGGANALK